MSNARSPREVCSMTIGTSGLTGGPPRWCETRRGAWSYGLLTAGCPQLRIGRPLLLLRRPQLLARGVQLRVDALDLRRDPVERGAQADVVAERLGAAVGEELLD